MQLQCATSPQWLDLVMSRFDAFLVDHAACERKASATAMSLVYHYPDRPELVAAMVEMAQEELRHFAQVYALIAQRGLLLTDEGRDPYVNNLRRLLRSGSEEYFIDRLLIAGLIEARGCERFALVGEALPAGHLKDFYVDLARAEARHHGVFVHLAKTYFDAVQVSVRLKELAAQEAHIVGGLTLRPALH